ncbi:hypothetical protein [Massilia horti]|uniref:Uncharacterized protein n=1 Tax=Massilia horti TaxID=2562153 RepID=A0A4Y9SVK7_9BURK|nr:hypothetical protein [Massilia horti]TFW30505.1 hypothetical protein E4O92_16455 [Massilia horti]TFW30576.1 hypothetical protein E4O92_16830 [Massilia horti]
MNSNQRFRFPMLAICVFLLALCAEPSCAQDDAACDIPAGLEQKLQPGHLVLIGEVHGTTESPAAFGDVVCRALEQGREVSVGLELNPNQVDSLAQYMASDGDKAAVKRFLHSTFWARSFQDGRSSTAMLALVERLRRLKQRYPALTVFVLDEAMSPSASVGGLSRDQRMAVRVRAEHLRRPQALVLTLTGNVHNRLKPMSLGAGKQILPQPMGAWLADLSPHSVLLDSNGGSAWVCAPACAAQIFPAQQDPAANAAQGYHDLSATEPYTNQWSIGPSTASIPAIQAFVE